MAISDGIWVLLGVVRVLWLARLSQLGLVRVYPYLSIYLAVSSVVALGGVAAYATLGKMSHAYGWIWVVAQLVLWTLSFGVIAEAYEHLLRGYARLQKLAKLGVNAALGAAGLIVLGMIFVDASGSGFSDPWRAFWFQQERSAYLALVAGCLLFVFVGTYYRLRISRNVLIIFSVFGFSFLVKASVLIFHNYMGPSFAELKQVLTPLLSTAALALGIVSVKREVGREAGDSFVLSPEGSTEIVAAARQLAAANDFLLKVLRS